MEQDPFAKKEQLDIKIEVVDTPTERDLKAVEELRKLAAADPRDAHMLVTNPALEASEEGARKRAEMFGRKKFVVFAWNGDQPAGIVRAEKELIYGFNAWYGGSLFVRKELRGKGIGKKMFATHLAEIIKQGGKKTVGGVKKDNTENIAMLDFFGYKRTGETKSKEGWVMTLDLTEPEVIKKINEVLNAR